LIAVIYIPLNKTLAVHGLFRYCFFTDQWARRPKTPNPPGSRRWRDFSCPEGAMDIRSFLREAGAAERIDGSVETLRYWRKRGRGPAYYRIEGKIYYDPSDIDLWLSQCRHDPEAA
jgi:hypothetical protein